MRKNYLEKEVDFTIKDNVLIVKEGTKMIPQLSFNGINEIKKIVFPSTLIHIGSKAFMNCQYLDEVEIPDSVRYISDFAFKNCNIKKLILGKNVTYIGSNAFTMNRIDTIINRSEKLKIVDFDAFSCNNKISEFDVSNCNGNVYLDNQVFSSAEKDIQFFESTYSDLFRFNIYGMYKKNDPIFKNNICSSINNDKYTYDNGVLKIHDGVEIIGDFSEFSDCKRIEMPDSVVAILYGAFFLMSKLEDVRFSNNLLVIFDNAFRGCSLKKKDIVLPNSLCKVKFSAFLENSGEEKIILPNTAIFDENFIMDRFYYSFYNNDFENIDKEKSFNVIEMLEEEKKLLKSLGLLPDTIKENSKMIGNINYHQSSLLNDFLEEFIISTNYDENQNIQFVMELLNLRETCVKNMHDVVNYLFDKKQIKTIYLLISYGYEYFNNSMISRAIMNSMSELIDVLLLLGTDINEIGTIETTPLSTACIVGNYNIAKYLIEKGAILNKTDKYNKSALDYAIENNNYAIVNLINGYNDLEKSESEKDMEEINRILGK